MNTLFVAMLALAAVASALRMPSRHPQTTDTRVEEVQCHMTSQWPPNPDRQIPTYIINLDEPAGMNNES